MTPAASTLPRPAFADIQPERDPPVRIAYRPGASRYATELLLSPTPRQVAQALLRGLELPALAVLPEHDLEAPARVAWVVGSGRDPRVAAGRKLARVEGITAGYLDQGLKQADPLFVTYALRAAPLAVPPDPPADPIADPLADSGD